MTMAFDSPDDIQAELGIRLRIARQAAGLSLDKLEDKSNGEFRRTTVGDYERGISAISAVRLIRLAALLGVSPGVLVQSYPRHQPKG